MIKMIYASDKNGVIGKDNSLPWHLPSDMKRFKALTLGDYVVMGRNTYESLPERFRPLPGRMNVVLSRSTVIDHKDVITLTNLAELSRLQLLAKDKDIWIIGGAQIYDACIDLVEEIHHTKVWGEYEGDTFFDIDKHTDKFSLVYKEFVKLDEDKGLVYYYDIYKRK